MIFTSTKRSADWLEYTLASTLTATGPNNRRLRAVAVHGDKSQRAREQALEVFRSGRVPIMVATDVAARGLDIRGVTSVVNFDFPNEIEM